MKFVKHIFLLALVLLLVLARCSFRDGDDQRVNSQTVARYKIQREFVDLKGFNESTPFVLNGELFLFYSYREATGTDLRLMIEDAHGNQELVASGYVLGSAFVDNNELYIFGTSHQNEIAMFKKVNGVWTKSIVLTSQNGEKLMNTSVTKSDLGYVLAYEVEIGPQGGLFSFKFAVSQDLQTWTRMNKPQFKEYYTACPTIRYFDDTYYVTYLVIENNQFVTRISKSIDLETWTESTEVVLAPSIAEGKNASDVDYTEYQGKTVIYYINGDQLTWGNLRRAYYNGGLQEFLESYFYY